MGITDRECRLCFALALWNGQDRILKERLYGLTSEEGNHGEDVKECYYYLDSTPTHSYMKGLYKYPLSEFPYKRYSTKTNNGRLKIRNLNLRILVSLKRATMSISSSNMRKKIQTISSFASLSSIDQKRPQNCICYPLSGFAILGPGAVPMKDVASTVDPFKRSRTC